MKWSRYSRLFQSKRNGWLLYNSAVNSFMKVEDSFADDLHQIMDNPEAYDFSESPQVYLLLRNGGHLVEEGYDDDIYNILKMRRLTENYASRNLILTIAVTKACNFACPYCFEGNRTGSCMSEEVEDKILHFIEQHKGIDTLSVAWYGGEPLLAIDRIRSFDKKLKKLGKKYSAMLITNGYCLNEDVIKDLKELQIQRIQITLDGIKDTHDSRRFLKNGGGTFDRIIENLDKLMGSDYDGYVQIRVNVDMRNESEFSVVYNFIKDRYPEKFGKHVSVYPGIVHGEDNPDVSCFFDSDAEGAFIARTAKDHNIAAKSLIPFRPVTGCTLTKRNAYVVGPEGELYKCWDDVGNEDFVIGSVDKLTNWNMPLIAEGMVGCSFLDSEECKKCFYFPVCNGGCHKVRMRNLHDDKKRDCCSYFKSHLEELLELYYEQKQKSSKE